MLRDDWGNPLDDEADDEDRARELFERRYHIEPGTGIVGDAINHAAIELLKSDPEEYFRLSRVWQAMTRAGLT